MTRPRWGKGLEAQRLPGYRVVVTEHTRHGEAIRHVFALDAGEDEDVPGWGRATETLHPAGLDGPVTITEPLPAVVALARGVDVAAAVLVVILDALVSDGRHRIDIADVKTIVSQLGSRIGMLETVSPDYKVRATAALYAEILRRAVLSKTLAR